MAIPELGKLATVNSATQDCSRRLGEFVRERRRANNLTQQMLGELAGVGTRFVSELERGKTTLRMDAVNRVLRVFGKTLGAVEAPRGENDL
jgi:y4mF family transcriptional regulator